MRFTRNNGGFTLVEVLVISPVIILFIGTFIALLVNLTGESLVVREKNVAVHDTQAALDDIQEDIGAATGYLTTTADLGTLQSPQGKPNGDNFNSGTAFTNTNAGAADTLIVQRVATTASPNDPSRKPIYTGAGACDAKNPIYTYLSVYFLAPDKDTSDPGDNALYKRTILPSLSACDVAWQRGSCYRDTVNSGNRSWCQTYDEKLLSGVSSFDVTYFRNGVQQLDSDAKLANDASVSLDVSKQVAGETINFGSSVRTSSPNAEAVNTQPSGGGGGGGGGGTSAPTNPDIQQSRSTASPYRTTITWTRVGNAVNYTAKYRVNGGTEQTVTIDQPALGGPSPTFNIDATARKQTVQLTELSVNTAAGPTPYGTLPSIPNIPSWNDCTLLNGWGNYGTIYGNPTWTTGGYTRTSSGIVGLKGLVKGAALNVPVCTLPEGFRPKFAGEKLIFQVFAASGWGRIDIHANGDIVPVQGNTEAFSLDGILFMSDASSTTWTNRSWLNSWTQYPSGHTTLRSTVDNQGRYHVQGLGQYSGTAPNSTAMTNIGSGTGPSRTLHYPAMSGGPGIVQVIANNGNINTRSSPNGYQQLQLIYRNTFASGWQNMPFSSGWTNYDINNWPTMQCHRGSDDVVIIQGLIRHPSDGNGAYIGDTSPCGRFLSGKGIGVEDRLILSPWTSNETPGRIDMINGISLLSQGTAAGWTALDGFHFIAD